MKTWKTKSGYVITRVLFGRSNVFLLSDGDKNILIDTSAGRYWRKLDRHLTNLKVSRIDYLILTHAHFDHAGNAQKIKKKYTAKVIIHRSEQPFLAEGKIFFPHGTTILTKGVIKLFGKKAIQWFKCEPCAADLLVDDQFDLDSLGFHASIIHTPGHSLGSMSVIVDDEIALVGDAMFGIVPGSVFPPFADDVKKMTESWGKLLETNCFVFLPAHGTGNSRNLLQREYLKKIESLAANLE